MTNPFKCVECGYNEVEGPDVLCDECFYGDDCLIDCEEEEDKE